MGATCKPNSLLLAQKRLGSLYCNLFELILGLVLWANCGCRRFCVNWPSKKDNAIGINKTGTVAWPMAHTLQCANPVGSSDPTLG